MNQKEDFEIPFNRNSGLLSIVHSILDVLNSFSTTAINTVTTWTLRAKDIESSLYRLKRTASSNNIYSGTEQILLSELDSQLGDLVDEIQNSSTISPIRSVKRDIPIN